MLEEQKEVEERKPAAQNGIKITGELSWVLKDERTGEIKAIGKAPNMVLDNGLDIIADRIGGTGSQGALIMMATGTSNTAVSPSQTDLQGSELARVATTESRPSLGKERFVAVFGAGVGTGIIEEIVLVDTDAASGARKCLCRVLTGTINKGAGDSWTGTYEITASRT